MRKFFQYLAFAIGMLTIVASGGGGDGQSGSTPAPELNTPPSYSSPTSFALSENNVFSQALTASDADGNALTFSLMSEGDSQFFSVTGVGVLSSTSQFDFETPDDTNGDNVYEITLRITDNEAPILVPLKINVQNVGPVFSSPTNFTIDENEFFFSKITASSNDGSVATVTVSASDDSTLFDFEQASGELSTSETFDYETPQDSNQDNTYILSVTASDGDEITVTDISINVQDINGIDQTLLLPDDTVSIFSGETAVRQISAQGPDGSDTVTYKILDGPTWVAVNELGELLVDLASGTATPGIYTVLIEVDDQNDAESALVENLTIEVLDKITLLSGTLGPNGGQLENSWRDIIVKADPNQLSQEYELSYFGAVNSSQEAIFKITTTPEMSAVDEDKITLIEPPLDIISSNYFSPISSEASSKPFQKFTKRPLTSSEVSRLVHPFEQHKERCLDDWVDVNQDGHRFDYLWKATQAEFNIKRHYINGPPRIWAESSWKLRLNAAPMSQCASTLRSSLKWDNTAISSREPVLFIHGFIFPGELGGFDKNYEYFGKFPGIVQNAEIDGRQFAPYLFSWRTNANYSQVAEDLAAAIETLNSRTGQKVHIVAHSYGGVLSRTLIQGLSEGFSPSDAESRVASLTTVGTPHSGVFGAFDRSVEVDGRTVSFPVGRQGTGTAIEGCLAITCHQTGEYWSIADRESTFYGLNGDDKKVGALSNRLAIGVDNYPDVPTLSLMGVSSALHRTSCLDYTDCSITPRFLPSSIGDGLISLQGQRFKPELGFNNIFENRDRIKERILDLEVVDVSDQSLPGTKYKTFREYGDGLLTELQQSRLGFNYEYEFANSYAWDVDSSLVKNSFGGIGHTASSASVDGFNFQNSISGSYNQVAVNSLTEVGLNICDRTDVLNCNHPTWLYFRDHLRENIAGSYSHQTAEINASISVTQNGATSNVPYTVIFSADGKEVGAQQFPSGTSVASINIPFNAEADYTATVIPDNGTETSTSIKFTQSKSYISGFLRSIVSVRRTTGKNIETSDLTFPSVELIEADQEAALRDVVFSVKSAQNGQSLVEYQLKIINPNNGSVLESLFVTEPSKIINLPIGNYEINITKSGYSVPKNLTCAILANSDNFCEFLIQSENPSASSISLISFGVSGSTGNGNSFDPSISRDGRYVVFSSFSDNLVLNDENGKSDIFLYDSDTRSIELITAGVNGSSANGHSRFPKISSDGSIIVFASDANNLVQNDSFFPGQDVFSFDRSTKQTTLISISENGNYANGQSYDPTVSGDGTYITFFSEADNLIDGEQHDPGSYVYNKSNNLLEILPNPSFYGSEGKHLPKISNDGECILRYFPEIRRGSYDCRDQSLYSTEKISLGYDMYNMSMSGDASTAVFIADTTKIENSGPNTNRAYALNLNTQKVIPLPDQGQQADVDFKAISVSADGNIIAFNSLTVADGGGIMISNISENQSIYLPFEASKLPFRNGVSLSDDGTKLAFLSNGANGIQLYTAEITFASP